MLLVDEVDRADDEFEAFLLEVLSTYQVTIPELGTVNAATPPVVVLTSNRTRELHDALKRRCLYHWIDHPGLAREVEIVRSRAPEVSAELAGQVVRVVQELRARDDLLKPPGVAETLDWARALRAARRDRARPGHRVGDARRGGEVPRRHRAREARPRPDAGDMSVVGDRGRCHEPDEVLLGFARALRAAGVPVTLDRSRTWLEAAALVDLGDRQATYWAGRATLCACPDDLDPLRPGLRRVVPRQGGPARAAGRGPSRPSWSRRRSRRTSAAAPRPTTTPTPWPRWPAPPRCCGTATSPSSPAPRRPRSPRCSAPCTRTPRGVARTAVPPGAAARSTPIATLRDHAAPDGRARPGRVAPPRHPPAPGGAAGRRVRAR